MCRETVLHKLPARRKPRPVQFADARVGSIPPAYLRRIGRARGASPFWAQKKLFSARKKKKARPFAQRKDFLRFRVGFCSKKTGNRRKKTSSPLPRSKNRGASPIRQWQGVVARRRLGTRLGLAGGGPIAFALPAHARAAGTQNIGRVCPREPFQQP